MPIAKTASNNTAVVKEVSKPKFPSADERASKATDQSKATKVDLDEILRRTGDGRSSAPHGRIFGGLGRVAHGIGSGLIRGFVGQSAGRHPRLEGRGYLPGPLGESIDSNLSSCFRGWGRCDVDSHGINPSDVVGSDAAVGGDNTAGYTSNNPGQLTGGENSIINNSLQIKALQPVYFATNREFSELPSLQLSAITDRRSMQIKYGLSIVSVPKEHVLGNVERPKFKYLSWRYEPETDQDHFRIKKLTLLTRDDFVGQLREGSDSVLLFVHGYNVKFDEAIYKAAQIAYDANFGGSVLVFSWPTAGGWYKYDYDRESADFSSGDLLQILRILTGEIGEKQIYVVVHSLGNQILVNALQQAALSKVTLNITELVLAAPDVDKDVFMKKASEIKSIAKNMTLYASSADKALLASDTKAWGSRMGFIDKNGPNLVEGIETIDVTAVGDDMLGLNHGTFSGNRAVLDDLGRLIMSKIHLRPHERTPTLKFMPDKVNVKYWLYPR